MPSHGFQVSIEGVDSPIDLVAGSGTYIIADDVLNTIEIGNTTDGMGVTDHGALGGLGDDDHSQYSRTDGTRPFSGTVSGVSPTSDAHLATKEYVDDTVAASGQAIEHGSLLGLGDNDHPQYVPYAGATSDIIIGNHQVITSVSGYIVRDIDGLSSEAHLGNGRNLTISRDAEGLITSCTDGTRTWSITRDAEKLIQGWTVA
jgi:hypothetical protein